MQAGDEARLLRDAFHVRGGGADVFGRDVETAERVDESTEGLEELRRLATGVADDDRLAAAERQVGHGVLEAHAAREPERIRDRFIRAGVRPHAATAGGRAQRGGVDGDDGAQRRGAVIPEGDDLVAVELPILEDTHALRSFESAAAYARCRALRVTKLASFRLSMKYSSHQKRSDGYSYAREGPCTLSSTRRTCGSSKCCSSTATCRPPRSRRRST